MSVVDVSAVLDAEDDDFLGVVIDAVEHPVGSAPRGPDALKFSTQHLADPAGVAYQGSSHELDHGGGDCFWKCGLDGADSGRGEDQLVALVITHRRRLRTAAAPRRT